MNKVLLSRLNYDGPRQIYAPNPIVVCISNGTNDKPPSTQIVQVPVPDSRTRVKVSLLFVPPAGTTNPVLAAGNTIWIAATEEDMRGGGGGRTVPVTDVEGTSAAPTAIPQSTGLLGYSREFVTAADYLQVTATLVTSLNAGAWVLQTQIQPDAVSFSWEEWDAIRRDFMPQNLTGKGIV